MPSPTDQSKQTPRSRVARAGVPEVTDSLSSLGISPAAARLLRYFVLHPDVAPHLRQLQRVLELGGASVQRDLERLVGIGALERIAEGRLVRYRRVTSSGIWQGVRLIVAETGDPAAVVRDALCDVSGVEAAFLFGSAVKGTVRPDSDVDVFVLEAPDLDRRSLNRQLVEAAVLLGREINAVRYTPLAVAERLGNPEHAASRFLRDVLAGPKQWIIGATAVLGPLAIAAGVLLGDIEPPSSLSTPELHAAR